MPPGFILSILINATEVLPGGIGVSQEGWNMYRQREAHRNRAKRMRNARRIATIWD